jgi:hypothetical protein
MPLRRRIERRGGTGDGPEPVRGVSQRLVLAGAEVGLRGDDVAVHPGAAGLPAGLHGADTGVILAGSLLLAGHPAAGVT